MRSRILVNCLQFGALVFAALVCASFVSLLLSLRSISSPNCVNDDLKAQHIASLQQQIHDLNTEVETLKQNGHVHHALIPREEVPGDEAIGRRCEEMVQFDGHAEVVVLRQQLQLSQLLTQQLELELKNLNAINNDLTRKSSDERSHDNCEKSPTWIKVNPIPEFHPQSIREVLDWESFDRGFVYSWRRYWRINGHMGNLRTELQQAITQSKTHVDSAEYAWQHGQFQLDTLRGITYLMDFESKHKPIKYKRIQMFRPMSTMVLKGPDLERDPQKRTVHLVMPLQGRATSFQKFILRLGNVVLSDFHAPFFLTVVYFTGVKSPQNISSLDDQQQTQQTVQNVSLIVIEKLLKSAEEKYDLRYRLLVKNEAFRRGVGLEVGGFSDDLNVADGMMEPVLFFCDVDMIFTTQYLYRCRANAMPGRQVYFPIPFSLFKTANNITVLHGNGDWRKYGLGMVCISRSDFHGTKGFSKSIQGWGREDVEFYERMLKNSSLSVIRAVDEGLIHKWHAKVCDRALLSNNQYSDCIQSKADWEGDKASLLAQIVAYEQRFGPLTHD